MFFEWDRSKEAANRKKHAVSFREAATVLGDPLSTTYPDLAHSEGEQRYVTIGMSDRGTIMVVAHRRKAERFGSSVRGGQRGMSGGFMKKSGKKVPDELLPEYDFASMPGGIRGKYVERYRHGTNLALLDRDVAEAFPDDRAVNEALRVVLKAAEKLSERTLPKNHKRAAAR